jgi:DNA-binding response OmpR family regulator
MKETNGTNAQKVLIVEDDEPLSRALATALRRKGFTVFVAETGGEGLKLCNEVQPDLVLLDILMPKMDGMSMLKELRQSPNGKDIPVMFLTNLSYPGIILDSEKFGVTDYIVKAFWSLDGVAEKVRTKLAPARL